tara:strand:- start:1223 stop:3001 length:1779 start_codon:yes stop_codon:yes gene_type:complete
VKAKIYFIADFLKSRSFAGGAENNDSVLLSHLRKNYHVHECLSVDFNREWLGKNNIFIIGNFVGLAEDIKTSLHTEKYIVYEHDHKYVNTRDPSYFRNFDIPHKNVINREFYRRAHAVVVLSQVCKEVIEKNLNIDNVHSIGCSLWSDEKLDFIKSLNSAPKSIACGVLQSQNKIKGQKQAEEYCKHHNISYDLISSPDERSFLKDVSRCEKFIFIPQVLETFCRLAAEIKMLNVSLITRTKMLGFSSEECFSLTGDELIEDIRKRKDKALTYFTDCIQEIEKIKSKKKIAFIGKFDKIYDEEGKARALESLGHEVIRFSEVTFNRTPQNSPITLFRQNPDILIYTKLRIPEAQQILNECKQRNITTVCWVPDLYFGLERESLIHHKSPIFTSDLVLTPDGGNQKKFKNLGVNHICLRQGIPQEYLSSGVAEEVEKDLDIVFIGTCQSVHGSRRRDLINYLHNKYGNKFHWFGKSGDNEIREKSLQEIYKRSKIVIGDCVPSNNYWSNRVYEVMGNGAFLLHPRVVGLENYFIDGKHAAFFEMDNFKDLSDKIEFYLNDPLKRKIIAQNGLREISENHTTTHRAKLLLEMLQ